MISQSPARTAAACAIALLAVGILRLPDPFLATVTAFVLAGIPGQPTDSTARRALSAICGWASGIAMLAAFPQEPWVSIPLFCGAVAWVSSKLISAGAAGGAAVFVVGAVASFSPGIPIVAPDASERAAAHLLSLQTAIFSAAAAKGFIGCTPAASAHIRRIPPNFPAGFATLFLIYTAGVFLMPGHVVPMSVAAGFSIVSIAIAPAPFYRQRIGGVLTGAAISVVFLTLLSGSGNSLALVVFGIAGLLALLSRCAWIHPSHGAFWSQAGATLAVAGTVFPAPPDTLAASTLRAAAVLAGVCAACAGAAMFNPRTSSAPVWQSAPPAFRGSDTRARPHQG